MSSKCLLVQGVSQTVSPLTLKQIFEQFGICQVEPKGDFALIQYQNPDSYIKVVQYLNNTDLMGKNAQKVSMQILDLATLNQLVLNNKINANSNPETSNMRFQQDIIGKNSQEKQFVSTYQSNNGMNAERKLTNSPFQMNATQNKPTSPIVYQTSNVNIHKNMGGHQNPQNMIIENNGLKEKENIRQPQIVSFFSGRQLDHEFFKSKPNKSSKISNLVQYYKNNKSNVLNDKVKIYSNQDEFRLDINKIPRLREQTNHENKQTQKFIDYEKYTIADLTTELKKRGISVNGTKQILKDTLERQNENIF